MTVRLRDRVAVTIATNLACVAAFYAPAGAVQAQAWLIERGWMPVRLHVTPAEPTAENRCPTCRGDMETCRCGTHKPGIPHQQSGGAR